MTTKLKHLAAAARDIFWRSKHRFINYWHEPLQVGCQGLYFHPDSDV